METPDVAPPTPPADSTSPPPAEPTSPSSPAPALQHHDETKLFVGQIPRSVDETTLELWFRPFGEIEEIFLVKDKKTGNSKGCCFVRFKTISSCERCIASLNNKEVVLEGSSVRLQVSYARRDKSLLSPPLDATEIKLFVGQLPSSADENDLLRLFQPFGEILEVCRLRPKDAQAKGAGFVRYRHVESAKEAIASLDGKLVFPGSTTPIKVDVARRPVLKPPVYPRVTQSPRFPTGFGWYAPNPPAHTAHPKLFVAGLGPATNESDLLQLFSHYGAVRDLVVLRAPSGQSKQCGFVRFASDEEASAAVNSLNSGFVLPGAARPLTVRFADSRPGGGGGGGAAAGGGGMPPEYKLFVGRLPPSMNEDGLLALFKPYGHVLSIFLMRDGQGVSKGSGFVHFSVLAHAEAAILALNGINAPNSHVPLTVSFALRKHL